MGRPKIRLNPDELRQEYMKPGGSTRKIALHFGVSMTVIKREMREHGVQAKTKTHLNLNEVLRIYSQGGYTIPMVASCLGVKKGVVVRVMRENNIKAKLQGHTTHWPKGNKPWSKGKTKEDDPRIDYYRPTKWRTGQRSINKGKVFSAKWRQNLSKSHRGQSRPWNDSQREKLAGKNHWNWQGGADRKYSLDWTNKRKRTVRARDEHTCMMCGKNARCVHHIDYDKMNSEHWNLILLCQSCHCRTTCNREIWQWFFEHVMLQREKHWSPKERLGMVGDRID